jgi:Protein of unknown function (DUF3309)
LVVFNLVGFFRFPPELLFERAHPATRRPRCAASRFLQSANWLHPPGKLFMLLTILIVVLILMLLGGGHGLRTGNSSLAGGGGILGLILVVVIVLVLMGRVSV